MRVSEAMKEAVVANSDISLRQAIKTMADDGIGSLIIVEKDRIVGILTERDVLKNVDKLDQKLSRIMTKKVLTIESKESLDVAAKIMSENKIKRLPVLKSGKLAGIITATNILANEESLNEEFFFE